MSSGQGPGTQLNATGTRAPDDAAYRLLMRLGRQYAAVVRSTVGVLSVLLGVAATGETERTPMLLAGLAFSPVGWSAQPAGMALWVLAETALTRLLWWLIGRAGAATDRSLASAERARADAAVAVAQREEERSFAATLHDTAATTLLMVGLGEVRRTDTWLARAGASRPGSADRLRGALG